MGQKKSVRACVAGLVFACAVTGAASSNSVASADSILSSISIGKSGESIAINSAGTFAYVFHGVLKALSKIDLETDKVTATFSLPEGYYSANSVNPAGTFGYALYSNETWGFLKIDLSTGNVVATIAVPKNSQQMFIDPAGTFGYVPNNDLRAVLKIDLATNTVVATITEVVGLIQGGAVNAAGTFAYFVNYGYKSIVKIDLKTEKVVATIPVESKFTRIAINPSGTFAYALGDDGLSKIDLKTEKVVATIPAVRGFQVTINPSGTFAYVAYGAKLTKINLITDTVQATIPVEDALGGLVINPAGTIVYVNNYLGKAISKIAITATDSQSISFVGIGKSIVPVPLTQLLGSKTALISATATSGLPVTFSSSTLSVCTVSGTTVTLVTIGDCTINANQAGGSGWDAAPQIAQTFAILPSPPAGEIGVSIKNGYAFTNTKNIALNLVWPEYATAARISNDGGFATSKTKTVALGASIDWTLDDSVKGVYTKVVYVRFNGVADISKTYTDDIILDTTAPTLVSSSMSVESSAINLSLNATDDITGVDVVQVKSGDELVALEYKSKISIPLADLSLSVSSAGVRKSATKSIQMRVSDSAGNWTGWRSFTVNGLVTIPAMTIKRSTGAKLIATYARLATKTGSVISLRLSAASSKYCKVSGSTLNVLKNGSCKVTVTVTPKKGRATSKTVTLRVTK